MTEGQETFEGMERATAITFAGMKLESFAEFEIGEEHEFKVRGRIVRTGKEAMKDGHRRHIVKVDVESVQPVSFTEPEPPTDPDAPSLIV